MKRATTKKKNRKQMKTKKKLKKKAKEKNPRTLENYHHYQLSSLSKSKQ